MLLTVAFVLLGLAAVGFFYRLLMGPSVGDRVIALDGLVLIAMSGLAVDAALTERAILVDVMVVVGLLGFVGTSVAARYIEGSED
ncbi:MAG: monovalent cation/H+ antiporter complex subunit F [Acidimicrobiales bacterium]